MHAVDLLPSTNMISSKTNENYFGFLIANNSNHIKQIKLISQISLNNLNNFK